MQNTSLSRIYPQNPENELNDPIQVNSVENTGTFFSIQTRKCDPIKPPPPPPPLPIERERFYVNSTIVLNVTAHAKIVLDLLPYIRI